MYVCRFLGIPTDCYFAIGAPTGLIYDAWNIRLLPHYALGVFFVLSHIASGLRVVLMAHGVDRRNVDRLWMICVAMSIVAAAAIIAGMCGVRIGALRSEEHTSELQSLMRNSYAVFCLKKKTLNTSPQ